MDPLSNKSSFRFLEFANKKEDAEKEAKLREAAAKIEQAIAREKSLNELVDYREPSEGSSTIDPANDTRSLYEKLQEQRDKKKEAIEESKKLSNFVSRLDEDDVSYLNELAKRKRDDEIRKRLLENEEQKRLEEKKAVEDELKLKESLKRTMPMSKGSSSLKAKLSSIKVKPKAKSEMTTTQPVDAINKNQPSNEKQPSKENPPSTSQTEKNLEKIDNDDGPNKRLKKDDMDRKENSNDEHKDSDKQDEQCYCQVKNVAKCIGILPSLPQITSFPSSDSEGYSDDNLETRIVPRLRKKTTHQH